jgi:ABC-type transport system involved in cytochrome c biogenesis ATPase subunit
VFAVTVFVEGRGGGEKEVTHVVYPREEREDVTVRCRSLSSGQKERKILSRVLVTIDGIWIGNRIY